jgi:hypothetical protein
LLAVSMMPPEAEVRITSQATTGVGASVPEITAVMPSAASASATFLAKSSDM